MHPFIKDLIENVYCRIQPSPISGVGVFAIRDIPQGIDPMREHRSFEFGEVKKSEVMDNPDIPATVKKLVLDMCPERDGVFDIPPTTLNEIGVSYYLNHSKTPNMECDDDGNFKTLVPIEAGTELLVDYLTYGAENL
jgi:uncharacterized protein